MSSIRPFLTGLAAGLLIALVRACAYMFAWGWMAHRSARAWDRTFDKRFVRD
jgi:enterochelin esterase-like enzyme